MTIIEVNATKGKTKRHKNIKRSMSINVLMLPLYTDWLALGSSESLIDLIGGLLCA